MAAAGVTLPLVYGEKGKVQLVLRLEHDFFVGHLEERGRPERCAQAKESQWSLFTLFVLPMQHLDAATDIQSLQHIDIIVRYETNLGQIRILCSDK